jgi:hypothetical protein
LSVHAPQELAQPVARAHQIATHVLDRAHQITEVLVGQRWHEGKAQLAGGQQPDQTHGVTTVGLDAIARRPGNRPRRRHAHIDATLDGGAGQAEPRRPRLIDRARRAQPVEEPDDLLRPHPQN